MAPPDLPEARFAAWLGWVFGDECERGRHGHYRPQDGRLGQDRHSFRNQTPVQHALRRRADDIG